MFPNEGTYVRRLTNPVSLAHEPMFISSRTYVLQISGGQAPYEENNYGEFATIKSHTQKGCSFCVPPRRWNRSR